MTQIPHPAAGHQIVLLVDDDVMLTDGLSLQLARPGRTIVVCNDLESAELVVEWLVPSHVVADVRLTGPFGYEGLDFIPFVKRHAPNSRVILITGDAPPALQLEASERGAVGFLQKPFDASALDATLDLLPSDRAGSAGWPEIVRVPTLAEIISDGSRLDSVWQPITSLAGGLPVGFEALTRLGGDSLLRNPEILFAYAERKQRVLELEKECLRSALRRGSGLARAYPLFINTHPHVFAAGDAFVNAVHEAAGSAGVPLDRVVLEITEQGSLGDRHKVLATVDALKQSRVRFAFDDVGMAYSHLTFIDAVRPSFLKVSRQFGTRFETDPARTKLVRNLLDLAREFECELILEGIESDETAAAALSMGVRYGQGYHFAQPAPAESFLAAIDARR